MKQYIDKFALVAEIERRIKECDKLAGAAADNNLPNTLQANELLIRQYTSLLHFLDTLEVEEVYLEKEIKDYIQALPHARTGVPNGWRLSWHEDKVMEIAKHFFELGLKTKCEQKPAWSYEDKANLNNIIWLCNNCINGSETTWIPSQATKIKHLIETIKERGLPQRKPDWSEEDEEMIDRVKESLNCFIDCLEENTDLEDDTRLSLIGNVKNEIKWVESLRDKTKWQPNTEDNKPSIKHSVLIKTADGVAEGEWQGNDIWYQYRWCSRLKDSDVLAWMELSDLMEEQL